jgi:serine/threonine-protein kinase
VSTFGRYQLLAPLAQGGMGELFLARAGAGPVVVLKRLHAHLAAEAKAVARFLEEGRVQAQLVHPSLVRVLELGDVEGRWFLAMEYVSGVDLRAVPKPLEPSLAVAVVTQAARGLHAAHVAVDAAGRHLKVVHGDVTPANLLLTFDGQVKVLDFGLSRARNHRTGEVAEEALGGTLPYVAPELLEGAAPSAASDQFALGVIAWELLTGTRLFDAESDVEIITNVEALPIPPTGASAELDEAVLRMLARAPEERFPSLAAAAEALEATQATRATPAQLAQVAGRAAPGGNARLTSLTQVTTRVTKQAVRAEVPGELASGLEALRALAAPFSLEAAEAALEPHAAPGSFGLDVLEALVGAGLVERAEPEGFRLT